MIGEGVKVDLFWIVGRRRILGKMMVARWVSRDLMAWYDGVLPQTPSKRGQKRKWQILQNVWAVGMANAHLAKDHVVSNRRQMGKEQPMLSEFGLALLVKPKVAQMM